MRLRFITSAHFGRSELTNFTWVLSKHPEFLREGASQLKKNDVVVLVSKGGDQIAFLFNFVFMERPLEKNIKRRRVSVLRSIKLRLPHGMTWDPLMLSEYAKMVNLEIEGLKTFEQYVKERAA